MSSTMPRLVLHYSPAACSLAAHAALEHAGLPFEPVAHHITRGEHLTPGYLAIHPMGRVPALEVDGTPVTELGAILYLVDRLAPEAKLLPPDPTAAAHAMSVIVFLASTLHIGFAHLWRPERFAEASNEATIAHLRTVARERLPAHFDRLESMLPPDGAWLGGEHPSIGDFAILPFWRWACRVGLPTARWTLTRALVSRLGELPAVQRALAREGLASVNPPAD